MYKRYLKRVLDLVVAIIGLIALFPVFLILTVGLYFSNKGKPFFYQERPGRQEKIFRIIKFKTMNDKTDPSGKLLPDNERVTNLGKFIRRTSLDEIPQLFNVLNGNMSLIGPRPLRTYYIPLYNDNQRRRHGVKPGITGWAQVNGRNTISWTQKFEYDVWYVDNISFFLDCKILLMTVIKVFKAKDINVNSNITMEPFNGKN